MKVKMTLSCVAALLFCTGVALGAPQREPNEHLKDFGSFIGIWRYEGPSLEEVPGFVEKGQKVVIQFSWRWILEKPAIMQDLQADFEGGKRISQKELIGWNSAEKKIVIGGMSSVGIMHLGTIQMDPQAKTFQVVTEGVNAAGQRASAESVLKKVDQDTLTFERKSITGNVVEGPSPIYTLKRVPRPAGQRKTAP